MAKPNAEATFRAKAPAIMNKLMEDFPITPIDAAAILGNLGHESAGLTILQEIKPVVKGSRGGYGWPQWTGPRRRAYEAYCKRNGLDPASDQANYAYLFLELKGYEGSEKAAIGKTVAADGLEAKVIAFELAFLRAGAKHYESRLRWAKIAHAAWEKNRIGAMPSVTPTSPPDAPVIVYPAPIPAVPTARPNVLPILIIGILAIAVFAWQWFTGQQAPASSLVFSNGAPIPQTRPQFFGGGSSSIVTEIGWQIALAFVGPLVSAAATAAVGWVVYWWGRVLKTEFDQKSADALHAALARGILAGVEALGVRAGRGALTSFAASYVQQWNGGTVKKFGLSHEALTQLAVPHLADVKRGE
jgi:hypothetical protein